MRSTIVAVVLVLLFVGTTRFLNRGPSPEETMKLAQLSMRKRDYEAALKTIEPLLASDCNNNTVMIAAEAATRLNDYDKALDIYKTFLQEDDSTEYLQCQTSFADLLFHEAYLTDAETAFRKVLTTEPSIATANRRMGHLLNTLGRRWESSEYFFAALQGGQFTVEDLLLLGNFEEVFDSSELLSEALEKSPGDPTPKLSVVHKAFAQNRFDGAEETLKEVIQFRPTLLQAHAILGKLYLESEQLDQIARWHNALPEGANSFPDIWVVRGQWARKTSQTHAAASCFMKAVSLEPNHLLANFSAAQMLINLGRDEEAKPYLERSELLASVNAELHPIYFEGPIPKKVQAVSGLMEQLGRIWEAWAWNSVLLKSTPQDAELQARDARYKRILKVLAGVRNLPSASSIASRHRDEIVMPSFDQQAVSTQTTINADAVLRFTDQAAALGVDFEYDNGAAKTAGFKLFESTGGGSGCFDLDLDTLPDLFFVQSGNWPVDFSTQSTDSIFRRSGEQFVNVTDVAGLREWQYGQGLATGDFDLDGFTDIFVANVGINALYHNNGDGTFSVVQAPAIDKHESWTTSAILCDLNGDELPDIYEVNYISGDEVFSKMCGDEVKRACAPTAFEGAQDHVYLSDGSGGFFDATKPSGLANVKGKGLGCVATDFGSGSTEIFVANDGVANFYFRPGDQSDFQLNDIAIQTGVALSRDGRAQACMGIAVDDADGDGLPDLFVTNFYGDSNTLYQQQPGGLFLDNTRDFELRTPSFQQLGFATQFLDADLDSWPDLMIVNGHIDDFTHQNTKYAMKPQLMRNDGGQRFVEVQDNDPESFLNTSAVGRSMAICDLDNDQDEDFIASPLTTSAAVVINDTESSGKGISIQLIGTSDERIPVGAKVSVTLDDYVRTRIVVSGSGYESANEQHLVIGVGDRKSVPLLEVIWPNGQRQQFHNVATQQDYAIVQGGRLFQIPSLTF